MLDYQIDGHHISTAWTGRQEGTDLWWSRRVRAEPVPVPTLSLTSGHNNICQPHGRLDVLLKGRLHKFIVLLNNTFNVPAALCDVPAEPANQPDVWVCVHKDFHIQELWFKTVNTPSHGFRNVHFSRSDSNFYWCLLQITILWKGKKKEINLLPYLKEPFVRKRHNSLEYDHAGTIHIFLHRARKSRKYSKPCHQKSVQPFNIKAAVWHFGKQHDNTSVKIQYFCFDPPAEINIRLISLYFKMMRV